MLPFLSGILVSFDSVIAVEAESTIDFGVIRRGHSPFCRRHRFRWVEAEDSHLAILQQPTLCRLRSSIRSHGQHPR